jgi:predicted house-cleaning noncanonical NTP pyrophosphatase (MazG superfamily)
LPATHLIRDKCPESIGNSKNLTPKESIPTKKWAHELNKEFSKEMVQMISKHMKKCSAS